MRNSIRLLLAALTAALAITLGAGGASALRSISLNPAGNNVEARSTALTFTEGGGGFSLICEVTLTINLNSAISKTAGSIVGNVIAAVFRNCRGGTFIVLAPEARNPWPIKFQNFTGTLPNITEVTLTIENTGFLVEAFFRTARCLYGGTIEGRTRNNPVNEIKAEEGRSVPLITDLNGGVACSRTLLLKGIFRLGAPQTMTLI